MTTGRINQVAIVEEEKRVEGNKIKPPTNSLPTTLSARMARPEGRKQTGWSVFFQITNLLKSLGALTKVFTFNRKTLTCFCDSALPLASLFFS